MQEPQAERQWEQTPRMKQQQAQPIRTQKERPDQKLPAWAEQKQAAKQGLDSLQNR
jgi:hypothetical protein